MFPASSHRCPHRFHEIDHPHVSNAEFDVVSFLISGDIMEKDRVQLRCTSWFCPVFVGRRLTNLHRLRDCLLVYGFPYHRFTCKRVGAEPEIKALVVQRSPPAQQFTGRASQFASLRFTLVRQPSTPPSHRSANSGLTPTSRLWNGVHQPVTRKPSLALQN